ncbi:MAG: 16S rRNA (guanine(966)-N(2))-methyltransferase RsmD [Bacilli bacterium]
MGIRIIAGKHKKRQLKYLVDEATRPTRDLIREAVFSALGDRVENAVVLDLFSGVGTYGLEALSRGAKEVTFVDKRGDVLAVLKENLHVLQETGRLFRADVFHALKLLQSEGKTFDVIFIDPPYQFEQGAGVINALLQYRLLNDDAIIIYEGTSVFAEDEIPAFNTKNYRYGKSIIQMMRKK